MASQGASRPIASDGAPPVVGAVQTHKGLVRGNNEDSFVFQPDQGRFAVIDGMGGQNAGEVAASLLRDRLLRDRDLSAAIFQANREIFDRASGNADEHGMGCVVTAVQIKNGRLNLAHVGDTRAYLARPSGCRLLTRDHTTATDRQQELALSDAVTRGLPGQHQVTRDVGGASQADHSWIVTGDEPFEPDDLLLLCSDGLHDLVSSDELYAVLRKAREEREEPRSLVRRLIQLALERGGKDNVTVLVVRREADLPPRKVLSRRTLQALIIGGLLMALPVAGAFAYKVGLRYWPDGAAAAELECLPGSRGLVEASRNPSLVYGGIAGLDGALQPGVFVPLGVLYAHEGESTTTVQPSRADSSGPAVVVRGLDLRFPDTGRHRWRIHVEPGATLELTQASIRAPNLELHVHLAGPRSLLRISDSHLEIARLVVDRDAAPDQGVRLRGGYVRIVETDQVLLTNPGPIELPLPYGIAASAENRP